MIRASQVLPSGTWDPGLAIDRVLIDFDRRHRRRIVMQTETGKELLVDLPQATRLRDGDGLLIDDAGDGQVSVVGVAARAEKLLDIHAHDMEQLVRIAWHLGNRHLPVQVIGAVLRIRYDHVIADMVRGLGGHGREIEAAFDPEAGAYAPGGHSHDHE